MAVSISRPLTRQTGVIHPRMRRPLMIRLVEGGKLVRIWAKGLRGDNVFTVTVDQIYQLGIKNKAAELKQRREQARAERRAARGR